MEINWGRMKGGKNIGIVGGREGGEGERKVVREVALGWDLAERAGSPYSQCITS